MAQSAWLRGCGGRDWGTGMILFWMLCSLYSVLRAGVCNEKRNKALPLCGQSIETQFVELKDEGLKMWKEMNQRWHTGVSFYKTMNMLKYKISLYLSSIINVFTEWKWLIAKIK